MDKFFDLPVSLRIRGSLEQVFSSWIDPAIAQSWLCDRMEGEWKVGACVYWIFEDYRQEILVTRIEKNNLLAFEWNSHGTQATTSVEVRFIQQDGEVGVKIRESKWELSIENVQLALDHACGLENILCRLKAWTEYKVKLR